MAAALQLCLPSVTPSAEPKEVSTGSRSEAPSFSGAASCSKPRAQAGPPNGLQMSTEHHRCSDRLELAS